jgi:hypothetical protein
MPYESLAKSLPQRFCEFGDGKYFAPRTAKRFTRYGRLKDLAAELMGNRWRISPASIELVLKINKSPAPIHRPLGDDPEEIMMPVSPATISQVVNRRLSAELLGAD